MSLARALEMLADVLPVVSYMAESFLYPGLIHCCWTLYIMLLDLFITIQASSSLVAWTLCEVVKLVDGVARFGGLELASGLRLENCPLPHILIALQWISRCVCLYSWNLLRFHFPIIHSNLLFIQDKWRNLTRATKTQLPAQKDVITCPSSRHMSTVIYFVIYLFLSFIYPAFICFLMFDCSFNSS